MKKLVWLNFFGGLLVVYGAAGASASTQGLLPDLELKVGNIEAVTTYATGSPTTKYKISLTVRNLSQTNIVQPVLFSYQAPVTFANGALIFPRPTTEMLVRTGLGKGEAITRWLWLDAASFQKSYRLTLDLQNSIIEANETNNTVSVTVAPTK